MDNNRYQKFVPNVYRYKIAKGVKLRKTLFLSGNQAITKTRGTSRKKHQPPAEQLFEHFRSEASKAYTLVEKQQNDDDMMHLNDLQLQQEPDVAQPEQLACAWTPDKYQRAKDLFEKYEMNQQGLTFEAIAEQLDLTKEQLAEGWLDYQKDRNMKRIKKMMDMEYKMYSSKSSFLRAKLVDMLEKDPFLSLTQMKIMLLSQLKAELMRGEKFDVSEKKIAWLLKSAGYTCRKYASIGANYEQPMEINQEKKIFQFCRFLKTLRPTKIPMFFYHEIQISKCLQKKEKWVHNGDQQAQNSKNQLTLTIRCLLSSQGIAVWLLSQSLFERSQFLELIQDLKQKGVSIEPIKRKYLILDKRVLSNKQQFCEVVQQSSFDILCQPFGSQKLNPIEKWFKALRNELQRPNGNSTLSKRQIVESLLKKYNEKSLSRYLELFPNEFQSNARKIG